MQVENPVEIVLAVPGTWLNRAGIVMAIARKGRGYRLTGDVLANPDTGESFDLEIAEHDRNLLDSFIPAGRENLSLKDFAALDHHTFTLYLTGPGGSLAAALKIMDAAAALLWAGGIALRVESSGAVHSIGQWLNFVRYRDSDLAAVYNAFVLLNRQAHDVYSCGMHNFGLRDGVISIKNGPDEPLQTLQTFLLYLLQENPELKDGTIFSTQPDLPHYRLKGQDCTAYPPGDLLYNPFGLWRLNRLK
jgi:hypothetical protein